MPAFHCDSGGGGNKDEGSQSNSADDYFSASDDATNQSQTKEGMPSTPPDPQIVLTYSRVQGELHLMLAVTEFMLPMMVILVYPIKVPT
jgi:hypothetical protein